MAHRTDDHSDLTLFKNRLWKLMEEKDIDTTKKLAKMLYDQKLVTVKQKYSYDEPSKIYGNAIGAIDKKIQKHLNADTAKELQGEFVIAYCTFFGCSSDYLFGFIDCKTHDDQFIHDETGLSVISINYLRDKARSKKFSHILGIFLKYGNFDNALFHIEKYMKAVQLYEGLTDIRKKRNETVLLECIQKDGDLTSYNYPYNDSLDKKMKDTEMKMDIEEFKIDQHFKFIIQEINRIAKQKAPDTT